jgi:hypothetical protein
MKQIRDGAVWTLTNIQQSNEIRIILADSTFRGEVLHIVNAETERKPSWEILLETNGGRLHWREQEHGGRVEQLKIRPENKKSPQLAQTRVSRGPRDGVLRRP